MEHGDNKKVVLSTFSTGLILFLFGGSFIYAFFQIFTLKQTVNSLSSELASTTLVLLKNTEDLSNNVADIRAQTTGLYGSLSYAQQNIDAVKTQIGGVEQVVGSISGSVGSLQKLALLDPELLKKYSKVFFMNENYVPKHLANVSDQYLYSTKKSEQFLTEASPFLRQLLDTAKASGVTLFVKSGYRSFAEQQSLKTTYSVIYGAGTANSFSADQGYSEHQLGTTVDFITQGLNGQLEGFEKTEAYSWLVNNAHRFGFILSYPEGNSHYVFEPWHWRFVGVKLASDLHTRNIHFYDMDQREIDGYLIKIFD
ncbi:MAG: hypothetical protein RJA61_423 [Candidatus Parcubacteria bacterium]|jgi:D-alanyl-D-alanine carboxypeptidase